MGVTDKNDMCGGTLPRMDAGGGLPPHSSGIPRGSNQPEQQMSTHPRLPGEGELDARPPHESTVAVVRLLPELQAVHEGFAPLLRLTGFSTNSAGAGGNGAHPLLLSPPSLPGRLATPTGASSDSAASSSLSIEMLLRPVPLAPLSSHVAPLASPTSNCGDSSGSPSCNTAADGLSSATSTTMPIMMVNSATSLDADLSAIRELGSRVSQWRAWLSRTEATDFTRLQLVAAECEHRDALVVAYEGECQSIAETAMLLRRMHVPPEVRRALEELQAEEQVAREHLIGGEYRGFCEWVVGMVPQWIAAAHERERESAARQAALEAAKRALEAELLRASGAAAASTGNGNAPARGALASAPLDSVVPCGRFDPTEPNPNSVAPGASGDHNGDDAYAALRRQAIVMLAQQETAVKARRTARLDALAAEEETLRATIAAREEERRRADRQAAHQTAVEQEAALRHRLAERERLDAIRREERRVLIEHLKAEEEILRARIRAAEERRAAEAEAARQREAEERRRLAERLKVEEEIFQKRLQEHQHMKYVQALAAAQAREYQEAETRRREQQQREEAAEAAALERSREALRRHEEEYERRKWQRLSSSSSSSRPPPPPPIGPSGHYDAGDYPPTSPHYLAYQQPQQPPPVPTMQQQQQQPFTGASPPYYYHP